MNTRQLITFFFLISFIAGAEASEKVLPLKAYFDHNFRWSPDKKYLVDISGEGNDTGNFIVYRVTRDKKNVMRRVAVLKRRLARDVSADGFTWLPKHPHAFVLAHRLPDRRAFIGFWQANSEFRVLRASPLGPHDDPDLYVYVLEGVSATGKVLYYHDVDEGKHSLRLPT